MTKQNYIFMAAMCAFLSCAVGGYAFHLWMNSTAAGWFMFCVLDAVFDIGIALRIMSKCDHIVEEK